ncbi:galactose mutarotase isoform X2 [Prorops nasuta]
MSATGKISITTEPWGSIDGKTIEKITLKNSKKQEVDIISYGATITAVRLPNKQNEVDDVVLGFDSIDGYKSAKNPYFGATIGRVANRIGNGEFTLNGIRYNVSKNIGINSLHGGFSGWNAKIWNTTIDNDRVIFTLLSEDGDEGYPGSVIASTTFKLNDNGELLVEMKAFTSKATPINLTNHSYFNLAGHGTNAKEIYNHKVQINANEWTVTDSESIPTGEIRPVKNSLMDLRNLTRIGDVINQVPGGGYDYNFCLPEKTCMDKIQFVAKVLHPESGRYLEVKSNQPGVQFYTSNFLPEMGKEGILGKNNNEYFKHGAFCLETQNYPDAINHNNFPNSILLPSNLYKHVVIYKFGIKE